MPKKSPARDLAALLVRRHDNTFSDELVVAAVVVSEAATLKRVSVALRKEAAKLRKRVAGVEAAKLQASALESFADKFLHQSQALKKRPIA